MGYERNIIVKNTGDKLSRQLLSLVDFYQGNNYPHTHINVRVYSNYIVISTFYLNSENLDTWDNENYTQVKREDVPFFTLKKLGMV